MPENEGGDVPETHDVPEYRGAALDAAALLMPAAVVAQPIVAEWAKDHFGHSESQTEAEPRQAPNEK
jgi:hypothetical protein